MTGLELLFIGIVASMASTGASVGFLLHKLKKFEASVASGLQAVVIAQNADCQRILNAVRSEGSHARSVSSREAEDIVTLLSETIGESAKSVKEHVLSGVESTKQHVSNEVMVARNTVESVKRDIEEDAERNKDEVKTHLAQKVDASGATVIGHLKDHADQLKQTTDHLKSEATRLKDDNKQRTEGSFGRLPRRTT